jgi:hypothetical protein
MDVLIILSTCLIKCQTRKEIFSVTCEGISGFISSVRLSQDLERGLLN